MKLLLALSFVAAACLVVAVAIVLGIILAMEIPQRLFSKRILPH